MSRRPFLALGLLMVTGGVILVLAPWRSSRDPQPEPLDPYSLAGRWRALPPGPGQEPLSPEQREAMERLRSVGYLTGSEPAPSTSGVLVHRPRAAYPGLNLYTSGHGPEAVLMDMEGRLLHRWSYRFRDAFPELRVPADETGLHYWRRVHLFENGDLLAIYEGLGMIKIDRASRLIWALARGCHHDLQVAEDGVIYVLTRRPRLAPEIHPREPILEDFITAVDPEGRVQWSLSVLEAFLRSPHAGLLNTMPRSGDLLHTNTVRILDGSQVRQAPWLRRGNVLVSLLTVNVVGVIDPVRKEAVWARTGSWVAQHTPRFLPSGALLLFDNRGMGERSRVLEIDPMTGETAWTYGETPGTEFYTFDCGASERLPNGNTLITESNRGRAFEVTRDGEIVWEFYNPARAGNRNELIATLFEMHRLERDRGDWLGR